MHVPMIMHWPGVIPKGQVFAKSAAIWICCRRSPRRREWHPPADRTLDGGDAHARWRSADARSTHDAIFWSSRRPTRRAARKVEAGEGRQDVRWHAARATSRWPAKMRSSCRIWKRTRRTRTAPISRAGRVESTRSWLERSRDATRGATLSTWESDRTHSAVRGRREWWRTGPVTAHHVAADQAGLRGVQSGLRLLLLPGSRGRSLQVRCPAAA